MTHSPVLLTLDAFAVLRLTRLLIADSITAPLRERLLGSRPGTSRDMGGARIQVVKRPWLAEFLSCPWCVSLHLAVLVVLAQALAPAACLYVTAALAFSALPGLLSDRL